MRKNSHGKILKGEFKKQYISTVPKFCSKNGYRLQYWCIFIYNGPTPITYCHQIQEQAMSNWFSIEL